MAPAYRVLLLCFISYSVSFPQSTEAPAALNTVPNIIRFADHLFCSGDYFRAAQEYERVLSNLSNDTLKFKAALGFSLTGNYQEARKHFNEITPSSSLFSVSRSEYFKTCFLENDYGRIISQSGGYAAESDSALQKLIFSAMLLNSSLPDKEKFFSTFIDDQEIKTFYERKEKPEYRSPAAAGIFSAIIPGSGKIYTGEYWDGIFSFLSTGVLAFLAYDNFDAGHDTRAWIFTGLAAFFYAGNIYGSIASAHQFNLNVVASFDSDFKLTVENRNYFLPHYGFCK